MPVKSILVNVIEIQFSLVKGPPIKRSTKIGILFSYLLSIIFLTTNTTDAMWRRRTLKCVGLGTTFVATTYGWNTYRNLSKYKKQQFVRIDSRKQSSKDICLSFNNLSLTDTEEEDGHSATRDLLRYLYKDQNSEDKAVECFIKECCKLDCMIDLPEEKQEELGKVVRFLIKKEKEFCTTHNTFYCTSDLFPYLFLLLLEGEIDEFEKELGKERCSCTAFKKEAYGTNPLQCLLPASLLTLPFKSLFQSLTGRDRRSTNYDKIVRLFGPTYETSKQEELREAIQSILTKHTIPDALIQVRIPVNEYNNVIHVNFILSANLTDLEEFLAELNKLRSISS